MSSVTVDARYLLCPLQVIRTQDHVVLSAHGRYSVRVLCAGPCVLHDIPSWCRMHGHSVCGITRQGDEIVINNHVGDTG
jgi:tRNA 2-thiouridine synthesizing protein A